MLKRPFTAHVQCDPWSFGGTKQFIRGYSQRCGCTNNVFPLAGHQRRYDAENMAAEQRRGEVHGKPLGRNHLFRTDDGFPICYHRFQGHVSESLASSWRETVTGDKKFTGSRSLFSGRVNLSGKSVFIAYKQTRIDINDGIEKISSGRSQDTASCSLLNLSFKVVYSLQ